MPRNPASLRGTRAPRVKLAGTVLALLRLQNNRQLTAKLHQLSVSGGLLHLSEPLDEGIQIEIIFHIGSETVRSRAKLLFPMWATHGCLQPFQFQDLLQDYEQVLTDYLENLFQGKENLPNAAQAAE